MNEYSKGSMTLKREKNTVPEAIGQSFTEEFFLKTNVLGHLGGAVV